MQKLIERYSEFLKEYSGVEESNGCLIINTPFMDRSNDYIQVFVVKNKGVLEVTDCGDYMFRFNTSGGSPDFLEPLLRAFNIRVVGESLESQELFLEATEENLPIKIQEFIQAIIIMESWAIWRK